MKKKKVRVSLPQWVLDAFAKDKAALGCTSVRPLLLMAVSAGLRTEEYRRRVVLLGVVRAQERRFFGDGTEP